jgi:hypothetical protein
VGSLRRQCSIRHAHSQKSNALRRYPHGLPVSERSDFERV